MEDVLVPIVVVPVLFLGLPWIILHYMTRWKTAATLTTDDEALLEDLYQIARRLDERMDTVERLVEADNPDFQRLRMLPSQQDDDLEIDQLAQLRDQKRTKVSKGRTAK